MKTFINSIFAGIMISIGSLIYLNCENKIVGAFLFSLGLVTIMFFGFKLFTGAIGYVRNGKQILEVLLILLGNLIGCAFILVMPNKIIDGVPVAASAVVSKLNCPLPYVFGKAVVCGIIIYICVQMFREHKNWLVTLIGIPTFILCGAEHSIADTCFIYAAHMVNLQTVLFLAVVVLGNAVGSLIVGLWMDYRDKLK